MSLLMDALKKAEQEKKEAAKKRKLAEDDTMHLEGSDAKQSDTEKPVEPGPEAAADSSNKDPAPTPADLSLEPIETSSSADLDESSETSLADIDASHQDGVADPGMQEMPDGKNDVAGTDFSEDITIKADTGEYKSRVMSKKDFELATGKFTTKKADMTLDDAGLSKEIADYEKSMESIPSESSNVADSGEHSKAKLELSGSYPRPALDADQTFNGLDIEKTFGTEAYEEFQRADVSNPEDLDSTYEETLPGISASELANDLGVQDQPTPVAAETIFSATGANVKPSTPIRVIMVFTMIVMLIAAGIVVYNLVTPINRSIPSPTVARGVETIITNPVVNEQVTNTTITTDESNVSTSITRTSDTIPDNEIIASGGQVNASITEDQVEQVSDPDQLITGSIDDSEIVEPDTSEIPDEPLAAVEETYLPEIIEPPTSLIRLTRSRTVSSPNQLIQEAFQAYQAGNIPMAEEKYLQAYEELPENRDVLLGLAAIAAHKGNDMQAMEIYLRLLRVNPLDNIARAAVLGYQSGEDGTTTESISAIKSMVYDYPDEPLLYFNLGKLYASRSSWAEAQEAFFDAYTLDNNNPDYALNLAVSLDRLGQKQAALDYYNTAVNLAGDTPAGFETGPVLSRIRTLTSGD